MQNTTFRLTEVRLDPQRFVADPETHAVAVIVSKHAEMRRAEYQKTEIPVDGYEKKDNVRPMFSDSLASLGMTKFFSSAMVKTKVFASDSVPWFEWLIDPQTLQPCAHECGITLSELAAKIAYQVAPPNWQAFMWMAEAIRTNEELAAANDFSVFSKRHKIEIDNLVSQKRSLQSKKAVRIKLSRDPRQKAKALVRECWENWQSNPHHYKNQAEFARDMYAKHAKIEGGALSSIPVIEQWCRDWKLEKNTSVN